jgi:mannose-1-phosphate guanylyltransferase
VSQPDFPKQFLSVFNNTPLIVQTIERINTYCRRRERVLIIPEELKKLTRRYAEGAQTIIEPMRRNTAAAICLAAMTLQRRYGDAVLHIMPADHIISPKAEFIEALRTGYDLSKQGYLVTYGVPPTRPETGYGYVEVGNPIKHRRRIPAFTGKGFTEKPTLRRARKYLRGKKFLWNSGIFSFTSTCILDEIERCIPDVYHGVERFLKTKKIAYFKRIPDISIDYGVMEKSDALCVVKGRFLWDDVGSWLALERYFPKDTKNNILIGDAKGLEIHDTIMYTDGVPLRAYDVGNMIIVASKNGVLVCNKKQAPLLKNLIG